MTIAPRWLGLPILGSLALSLAACPPAASAPSGAANAGGELTCAERLQAQAVCLRAMSDRCAGQQNECDAACDSKNQMSANSRKHPSDRDELDAPRCRDACRVNRDACVRSTQAQCPAPCASEPATVPGSLLPAPAPSDASDGGADASGLPTH